MAQESESMQSLLQLVTTSHKECACPKIRRVGSKGAVLVVAWTYLAWASIISLLYANVVVLKHPDTVKHPISDSYSIVAVLGPVIGLVASAYCRRYNVLYASYWFMWGGSIANAVFMILLSLIPETNQVWAYSGHVFLLVCSIGGFTSFTISSVLFGLDQMPDASSEQITAFIHWYVWSVLAGIESIQLGCSMLYFLDVPMIPIFLSFTSSVLLTVGLCSLFLRYRQLIIEPESTNPLKTIFNVLRYAVKHKVPVQRSAFTYWETGIPSRINLGKSKYGGPFTTEEVEDVKTCLRMLVVIVSVSVSFCAFCTCTFSLVVAFQAMLNNPDALGSRKDILRPGVLLAACVLFSLPVYDTILHPLIRRCVSGSLRRVGLAQAVSILTIVMWLLISIAWCISQSPGHCMLAHRAGLLTLPLDYRWVTVPTLFTQITYSFLLLTAMLEFICAQAPYNLRGLLVGLLFPTLLPFVMVGEAIVESWESIYGQKRQGDSMRGIWFYLFTTITAILGCLIWCVAAKWYKNRERDEPEMIRIFAENYYSH